MNKTIAIELGGLRFHLQQDAFSNLETYLMAIEQALQADPSADEIMSDIEARIAELLHERLAGFREVVNVEDIQFIIDAIGAPEDFEGDAEESDRQGADHRGVRRLYRDAEEAMIGGVASGLAAYFGMDPVWIRGAFVVTLIAGGFAVPVYLILWLIVPKAETRADRLTMHGRPVNFENIRSAVGQEVNQAGKRVRKWGRHAGQTTKRGMTTAGKGLSEIFAFALRGIGWFFLFSVLVVFVVTGTSVLAFLSGLGGLDIAGLHIDAGSPLVDGMALILPEGVSPQAVWIGALLLLVMPIAMLSIAVVRLLFRAKVQRGFLAMAIAASLLLSAAGATVLGVIAARVGLEFQAEAKLGHSLPLRTSPSGQISLEMPAIPARPGDVWFTSEDGPGWLQLENDRLSYDAIRVDVERTADSVPRLEWEVEASGASRHQARERCLAVDFPIVTSSDSSAVTIPEMLSFPASNRFRGQAVRVTLYLPEGDAVHLHASLAPYLRHVENVDQMSSSRLAGRDWVMTKDGLSPLNL